ncbi:hypothetical protein BJ165DRAFT_304444 [Panaeolus papilionaceus]|nr:hypothetical protein BJ165DRAFT_304444 [Panaeolus papilionaceus]
MALTGMFTSICSVPLLWFRLSILDTKASLLAAKLENGLGIFQAYLFSRTPQHERCVVIHGYSEIQNKKFSSSSSVGVDGVCAKSRVRITYNSKICFWILCALSGKNKANPSLLLYGSFFSMPSRSSREHDIGVKFSHSRDSFSSSRGGLIRACVHKRCLRVEDRWVLPDERIILHKQSRSC